MTALVLAMIATTLLMPGMRGRPASRPPTIRDFLLARDAEVKRVTSLAAQVGCPTVSSFEVRAQEAGWIYWVGYDERRSAKRKRATLRWNGLGWDLASGDTSRCNVRLDR